MLKFPIIALSCLALVACEKTVIHRGYIADGVNFKQIKVGDHVAKIYSTFGAPTLTSSVNSDDGSFNWFYITKKMEKVSFLDPKVTDQMTHAISFDKNGVVTSVKEFAYEKSVGAVKESVKTEGRSGSIVEETFGGIGKYTKRYTESGKKK